ncbi:MAG: hypothetical protein ACKOEX_15105, partial [Planctomycetia bacterium]
GRGGPPAVDATATGRTRWLAHAETFATDAGPGSLTATLNQLVGDAQRGLTLLKLSLGGSLGLAGHEELETILKSCQAGLLDLRLDRAVAIAPSPAEIDDLTAASGDPVIKHVAAVLRDQMGRGGDAAAAAGVAIALLYESVHVGGTR